MFLLTFDGEGGETLGVCGVVWWKGTRSVSPECTLCVTSVCMCL